MHHIMQLRNGCVTAHQHTDLLHDVSSMGTKGMTAQ